MERLLLLDADVIIWLNQVGLWDSILKNYEIHVASTVVNEATHYSDEFGRKISIDLNSRIDNKELKEISADVLQLKVLVDRLPRDKIELHDGELESLAVVYHNLIEGMNICLIDRAAIIGMAYLEIEAKGRSVEEVLLNCGLSGKWKKLAVDACSKKRFRHWVTQGKMLLVEEERKGKRVGGARD